jgi:E3 ubiquitin-protein ligase CCNP1IP1
MQVDQDGLRRKNEDLVQALREKSRKQLQTQELYDKLKRRAMLGQVQNAALDAVVDQNIQASVAANRFVDRADNQHQIQQSPLPPLSSNQQTNGMQHPGIVAGSGSIGSVQFERSGPREDTWAGFSSQGNVQRRSVAEPSPSRCLN